MERMTGRWRNGMVNVPKGGLIDALERFASIEDILGEDYDLDRLREMVEADRNGILITAPFKVDDAVYKDIANRLRKWANGETCEDCPAKDDLAFCAADAIYDLLSRVEALRPVSREQVEKVWRGEWIQGGYACGEHEWECSKCHEMEWRTSCSRLKFCPFCGIPMTDEAVEMVMERLEALHGQENS